MMAGKAKLLANIIEQALDSDEENHQDRSLKQQMETFKSILIHDINAKQFADVYAQTIAYGMFAARLQSSRCARIGSKAQCSTSRSSRRSIA